MTISQELDKWENRIYYKEIEFKTNRLDSYIDEVYNHSFNKFIIASVESTILCYKMTRYMIAKGYVDNSKITFVDGDILDNYIGDVNNDKYYKIIESVDNFFVNNNFNGKWVIIDNMYTNFSKKLALYVYKKFIESGAIGMIVYAGPQNNYNFVASLVMNVKFVDIVQIPPKNESPKIYYEFVEREIEKDEW